MKLLASNDPRRAQIAAVALTGVFAAIGLFITHSAMMEIWLIPAAVYAGLFMVFAWRFRTAAIWFIYVSSLFPSDIGGAGIAIGVGELHLALVAMLMILDFVVKRWPIPRSPLYIPVTIYLAICVVSSMQNWRGPTAAISIVQMVLYFLICTTVFSTFLPETRQHVIVVEGIVYGGIFLALATTVTRDNFVFGMHKNAIGGALSYAIVACLELWFVTYNQRRKQLLFIALLVIGVGLFFTLSRGGWLGAITGIIVVVILRGELKVLVIATAIIIPLGYFCMQFLPEDQRGYIFNFDSNNVNIADRIASITYAMEQFNISPWIGMGVGLRKTYDATNVVYMTLAETGILGFLGFMAVNLTLMIMVVRARFMLHRDDPRFSLLAIGGGLVLGKVVHGCVDHYWSRGSLVVVWGAAGMAIAAYYSALRNPSRGSFVPEDGVVPANTKLGPIARGAGPREKFA